MHDDRRDTIERAYEHWPAAFGLAVVLLGDRARAEELCQDTFVRLMTTKTEIDGSRPLGGLVLTTTRNLCLNELRRHRPGSLDELREAGAPEPVERPHDEGLELATMRCVEHRGELWSGLRCADLLLERSNQTETAGSNEPLDVRPLVVERLLFGADPQVDRCSLPGRHRHWRTPLRWGCEMVFHTDMVRAPSCSRNDAGESARAPAVAVPRSSLGTPGRQVRGVQAFTPQQGLEFATLARAVPLFLGTGGRDLTPQTPSNMTAPMTRIVHLPFLLGFSVLGACGDDPDSLDCGVGTVEVNGVCQIADTDAGSSSSSSTGDPADSASVPVTGDSASATAPGSASESVTDSASETVTDSASETASSSSGSTGGEDSGGGDAPYYGPCPLGSDVECVQDANVSETCFGSLGTCSDPCTGDLSCPAPASGNAVQACQQDVGLCILLCGEGVTCPSGMECAFLDDLIQLGSGAEVCTWPK